jgi:hypothetical protein
LCEALRVARRGLLIGALNRWSRLGRRLWHADREPWRSARLLTVSRLLHHLRFAAGRLRLSIRWSTTLWAGLPWALPLPWGDFIGLAARWTDQSIPEDHP